MRKDRRIPTPEKLPRMSMTAVMLVTAVTVFADGGVRAPVYANRKGRRRRQPNSSEACGGTRIMRPKKDRRIPTPEEVPSIFDDKCIRELARTARLPRTANIPRFGVAVRDAALVYIRDASMASDNEVHHEVDGLLRAADRAVNARKRKDAACENVAVRIERLTERTRKLLNERGTLPDPAVLRDPISQSAACEIVAKLCRIGAFWQEGRRRPGGERSTTMVSVLHAPALEQHPARREAQLYFMTMLRLAVLEATGMPSPRTVDPGRPTPFAQMAQACLNRLRAGANAVELINELQRRRKDKELRQSLSGQNA